MSKMKIRSIKEVARYVGISLLSKGMSVSPLKLQKILYYVQSWYMVMFGRENTLFDETPQAWINGPVYPSVFREYKDLVEGMCDHLHAKDVGCESEVLLAEEAERIANELEFDNDEIECIDSVVTLYGAKTQNQLIFMTHSEKPWAEQREGLSPFDRSQNPISLDTMHDFYKARYDRNHKNS